MFSPSVSILKTITIWCSCDVDDAYAEVEITLGDLQRATKVGRTEHKYLMFYSNFKSLKNLKRRLPSCLKVELSRCEI